MISWVFPCIGVRELAAAGVELAVFGDPVRDKGAAARQGNGRGEETTGEAEERATYDNAELVRRGRAATTAMGAPGGNLN